MSNLELEIAESRYQIDPSPANQNALEIIAVAQGYLGFEKLEAIQAAAKELTSYINPHAPAAFQIIPGTRLENLQIALNCPWKVTESDINFRIGIIALLEFYWHLRQHPAILSFPTRKTLNYLQKIVGENGPDSRSKCVCRTPFQLCQQCGKPECVCEKFYDRIYGQAMGGYIGATEHPLPELCDCHGGGWITTDADSLHQCHFHKGHHPECGDHFLGDRKKAPCDCGYAKEMKLASPCEKCGIITNTYCDLHRAALCEKCTTYQVCGKCGATVCKECSQQECSLCHLTGCQNDIQESWCEKCGRGKEDFIYQKFCKSCLKMCPGCHGMICKNCIGAHRQEKCTIPRLISDSRLRDPHWR